MNMSMSTCCEHTRAQVYVECLSRNKEYIEGTEMLYQVAPLPVHRARASPAAAHAWPPPPAALWRAPLQHAVYENDMERVRRLLGFLRVHHERALSAVLVPSAGASPMSTSTLYLYSTSSLTLTSFRASTPMVASRWLVED